MCNRVVCLLLGLSLIAACGGGGGGIAVGSDPGPMHATSVGGTDADIYPAVAAFSDGSRVLTGGFRDLITLGAGEPNEEILIPTGNEDLFVARFFADGTLDWASQVESTDIIRPRGVSSLPDGSCLVTGYYRGTATFGPGEGNQTVLGAVSNDVFLARFSTGGSLVWAKRAGGNDNDTAEGVSSFADGSCVVTGWMTGPSIFGPLEVNQTILVPTGGADMFVARFNADGTLAWARQAQSVTRSEGVGVGAVPDGSCCIGGWYEGSTVFGNGDPNQTTLLDTGQGEVYVARFNADGTLAWVKRATSLEYDAVYDLAAFADGSCVVVGESDGEIVFGPGEVNETTLDSPGIYTPFVARYAPGGTLQWARTATGSEYHEPYGVTALSDGSCVAVGLFSMDATFGLGEAGQTTLVSVGEYDLFVARYATNGSLAWARRAGGPGSDEGLSAAAHPDGGCVVAGTYRETAVFGPGEVHQTALTAVGTRDIFLAHYGPNGDI